MHFESLKSTQSSNLMKVGITLLALAIAFKLGLAYGAAADGAESMTPSAAEVQEWGEETLGTIRQDFWLEDEGLYAERVGRRRWRRTQPAFMWGAGVQLSALAGAARLNADQFTVPLAEYAKVLKSYWHEHNGVGGYDVQPNSIGADRYYDDNAWIVLALVEAFETSQDQQYLDDASKTLEFVLSGEDDTLGGGIYWRENEKESKNTCSSAPATVGALRLYQHTQRQEDLATSRRLYAWTCLHLQDEEDGLFWDNIALDGRVDRRKFSYNSALMIRANCLLYEITKEAKYLAEAQRIAAAAQSQWVDSKTGAMKDTGKFAHMLLEAFLAVHQQDGNPQWLQLATRIAAYVRNELRDPNGRYSSHWDRPPTEALRSFQLIDQASAARAFVAVADALSRDGKSKSGQ